MISVLNPFNPSFVYGVQKKRKKEKLEHCEGIHHCPFNSFPVETLQILTGGTQDGPKKQPKF